MNGRIYDPELGRMLSPDPFVQVPEYSQNFNRYSYVLNNPLNLTDPTGYSFLGDIFHAVGSWLKENWRTIVVIVVIAIVTIVSAGSLTAGAYGVGSAVLGSTATTAVTAAAGGTWAVSAIGGAFLGGISGGLTAALNGGDIGDVLRGATIQGLQGGITAGALHSLEQPAGTFNYKTALHISGHGVVGGAANEAMGGKFQDGFYSAAVSAAAADAGVYKFGGGDSYSVAARTAVAGIVGGTASAIGGGKFANGAFTAAFQHYLNAESEDTLGKMARRNAWSPERRNKILNYYRGLGLDRVNQEISNLKNALYVNDETYKSYQKGDISLATYEQMQANNYQSLEVAQLASASLDPNYKYAPVVSVTGTVGYSAGGRAIQGGVSLGTDDIRSFLGYGAYTPGPIFSLSVSPGEPPDGGTWTTSYSGGNIIGAGRENGSWGFQFTNKGAGIMRNYWTK